MYAYRVCRVQILAGGEIYQIEAENGDRGYYLKEMVTDQRPSPPDVEVTVVRLDPNAAIIYHPQNSPPLVKEETALEELPPMGMPVFGQFYSIGFGLPIQHARLDPFWAVNFNAPEFLGCGSSPPPLLPQGGLPPPIAWREGNPCREYLDELGRPLLSVSFPMFPDVPARHGNVGFRFIEGRMGDEQRLVSGPYNHVARFVNMHASHLSRHGHCGSPWRTNLTPASDTCNVKLIGQFEGHVMGRMGECYGTGGTIDLADPGQAVLVYVVQCYYKPSLALQWLVGCGPSKVIFNEHDPIPTKRSQALWCLSQYLPILEIRQMYGRVNGKWLPLYTQCHDLQAIMRDAGSPLEGRYHLNDLDDGWGTKVLDFFNRDRFRLRCDPGLAARNEGMFMELANLTGFQLQQDIPGGLASQYLDTTQRNATTAIPFIDHGTRKLKENIDLYMLSGMVNQSLVELLAQQVLGLELAREEKLELMEPLGRQFPMVMEWLG